MSKEENQIRFSNVLDDAKRIRWEKYQQYGDCYSALGSIGLIARINDKISRIVNIYKNKFNKEKIDFSAESVRDNLIDIINYCAMAIMVIEEEQDGK